MTFNSYQFLIFFPIVYGLNFALPQRLRSLMLLVASCLFYMAFVPQYILVLGFTIVVDYYAGLHIEQAIGTRRRAFLIASIVANVGMLAIFKYYNFFAEQVDTAARALSWKAPLPLLSIVLPIGLSFHTFQAMSYTIEVYRGNQRAERSFIVYALYVMFFPQLVAGPIERATNLLAQFHKAHRFDPDRFVSGLTLALWGLFKKVVIADRLAHLVGTVYDNPYAQQDVSLTVATVLFAYQIFCDFSGYSDIAIGTARMMGFDLMTNFRSPYLAASVPEFWRRWHISLSSWFRDYLYFPLGGNRRGRSIFYRNVLIVFLLCGLWHGANWTFIVWGGLHGTYLILSVLTDEPRRRLWQTLGLTRFPALLRIGGVMTTFALVCVAWTFFRARNVDEALFIARGAIVGGLDFASVAFQPKEAWVLLRQFECRGADLPIAAGLMAIVELYHLLEGKQVIPAFAYAPLRWSVCLALVLAVMNFGVVDKIPFIYFQF